MLVSQAVPAVIDVAAGQSVVTLQPHVPATQAWPVGAVAQSVHAAPSAPQLLFAVPAMHVPAEQQPPLQGWFAEQVVVQRLVVVSQAYPAGQSVAVSQPHRPVARQMFPTVPAVQSTQIPLAPQAVLAVPAMQIPLVVAEQHPV